MKGESAAVLALTVQMPDNLHSASVTNLWPRTPRGHMRIEGRRSILTKNNNTDLPMLTII